MKEPWDDETVVAALQYDEVAVAADLAAWCNGEVLPGTEGGPPLVWVPTFHGPRPAALGDWIVRRGEGDFYPCPEAEFALRHAPVDERRA